MDPSLTALSDDGIPSYEESLQQGVSWGPSTDSKNTTVQETPLSLNQQLSDVRAHRISSILKAYIDPLLQSQALAGLYKTTLVLVPSNVTPLQRAVLSANDDSDVIESSSDTVSHDSAETVVGFPSTDYVKLVRLHGEEYVLEFWRQPAVIAELNSALGARLQASGHRLVKLQSPTGQQTAAISPTSPEPSRAKKGFFRRSSGKASNASVISQSSPIVNPESNWRLPQEKAVDPGHVKVEVGLQDICLRVVTEMGLYETRNGKAVVIHINIGS